MFNVKEYILWVRDLDKEYSVNGSCSPERHEYNVLTVLAAMLKDGAPLWAVTNFLTFVR